MHKPSKKRGRPRKVGKPLPKLKSYLNAADECWTRTTPSYWYGSKETTVEFISKTGLWYRAGTPPTALRWVLVRDPEGEREPQAFFCTDLNMEPSEIIAIFAMRWEMEVTFQEARAHLGIETQRQWSEKAITRTTPYCSASTVWFVSGRTRLWKQIRCHMLRRGIKRPTLYSQMQLL